MQSQHYKLNKASGSYDDPYDHTLEDYGVAAVVPGANAKQDADPTVYPCDVDEDTRNKIDHYLLRNTGLEILVKGSYQTKYSGPFSLQHDLYVYGDIADIHDRTKSNGWLENLLKPEFENKIFDAGRHILPVYDKDGLVSHYFSFSTNRRIIVRKDNYGNMVCDVISNKELGAGSFGAVYMIDGTIKYRYDDNEGYRFEAGDGKRVVKIYKDRKEKTTQEQVKALNNEICFTRYNKACRIRSGFFGEFNRHQRSMGFSSRYIPEMELFDLINNDCVGRVTISSLDRIRLIIAILKAVRDQAHQYNIVHRDLKPDNIRVQRKAGQWIVNILDYGLAKLENSPCDGFKGTSAYIPVEVIDQICQKRASDIFSVGLVIALILRDSHQMEVAHQHAQSIYDTRDSYDWNIPLDRLFSYGLEREYSQDARREIKDILEDMLVFGCDIRPGIDNCINRFEQIYQTIHDEKYSAEQLAAVQAARESGRKFLSLINDKLFTRPTREVMEKLLDQIRDVTVLLPSKGIYFDEFLRTIDCKFTCGVTNKDEFHKQLQAIVQDYFAELDKILAIYCDLNDMVTRLSRNQDFNHPALAGLKKTVSQLGSFMDSIKTESSVNLDVMQLEIAHLRNKYRKELSYQQHFHKIFDVSLNGAEHTVSATAVNAGGPRHL